MAAELAPHYRALDKAKAEIEASRARGARIRDGFQRLDPWASLAWIGHFIVGLPAGDEVRERYIEALSHRGWARSHDGS